MKTIIATLLGTLMYLGTSTLAFAQTEPLLQDTLTIEIGADKKVIILVKDKQALKSLQQYDLNKMVRDLNEKADTVNHNQTIVITDQDGTRYRIAYSIEINEDADVAETEEDDDDDDNFNINFSNKGKNKEHKHKSYSRTRSSFLIDLGVNNFLEDGKFPQEDDAQYAVKPWGSWYVGLGQSFTTQIAGPLALQWGAGVNWYNFKFEDQRTRLNKTEQGVAFTQDLNSEVYSQKSKLTASYITLQAVPMLDFGYRRKTEVKEDGSTAVNRWHTSKAFRIGLGGYASYRLGSYTKYKFEIEGDEKKDRNRDNYYLNNWRYGVRAQVGYKGIDLFAQYDLNELFIENRGPQLNAFSFGIML
ncbi:hypothetical protein [Cesiribacter sp. SM1]|uniref:hypothetical protein n=1 Tax=Cesiribacter sp. SM1 TaxID=2861196 RepID=UPI001CD39DE9|nr:hypothetical protein [Cesiribacter sp. SM1]